MMQEQNTLAILCGGGPAPGINSVISSVSIEAKKKGWEVLGILDGFSYLAKSEKNVIPLTIDMVSRIHLEGGSILRTSRYNPTKKEADLKNTVSTLIDLGVTHLVTIGGDDTAFSASKISNYAKSLGINFNIVHVPKTIDNDLPLPEGIPTFGFETARSLGASIVTNLMTDAKTTTGRWYLAVAMGRTAGHLALGIGKSAGATVTIVPEEFSAPKIRLQTIIDILTGSIIKRLASNKNYGVAIVAEGLIEKIEPEDLQNVGNIVKDEHGNIRYSEINFANILKHTLQKELTELGIKLTIVDKEIGYEVRCAPPNAFDIEYTRNLGFAAFDFLANGGTDAIITIQNNQIVPISFEEILDNVTGKTHVRMININSIQYRIATQYMIRLEKDDFISSTNIRKLALIANLSPDDFKAKYEYLTTEHLS